MGRARGRGCKLRWIPVRVTAMLPCAWGDHA